MSVSEDDKGRDNKFFGTVHCVTIEFKRLKSAGTNDVKQAR